MEEEKTGIRKELSELRELLEDSKKPKEKKFRLPWKAKIGKRKLKQGYATILVINENKEVDFMKKPIEDSSINLGDTFHANYEDHFLTYKGKPFLIQPKGSLTSWNPLSKATEKNETYGQKYVMARMKSDFIKTKGKIGWGASIFGIVILGIIGYSFITGS